MATRPGFAAATRAAARPKPFKPGGEKGKLHRELGIAVGEKIPAKRLEQAAHSKDREVRDDAIRAQTMERWHHGGRKKKR